MEISRKTQRLGEPRLKEFPIVPTKEDSKEQMQKEYDEYVRSLGK